MKYFVVIREGFNEMYAKKSLRIHDNPTSVIKEIASLSNEQKLIRIQKYSIDNGTLENLEIKFEDGRFDLIPIK